MAKKVTNNYGLENAAKRYSFNGNVSGVPPKKQETYRIGHKKPAGAKPPSQLEQIFTGWGNYIKSHFVDLSPDLKEEGEKRLKICHTCDMRNGGTCSTQRMGKHVVTGELKKGCGCRLAAKALSPGSECPLGKW